MRITNTGLGILGSRLLRRPFYGRVHVTYRCNYRCQMCGVGSSRAEFEEMRTGDFLTVAERLWSTGARHVVLTGGEPFLRKDLPAIVATFARRGFSVRIQTNGGPQVTPERLAEVARAGATDLSVSVDTLDAALQDAICGGRGVLGHALATLDLSRTLFPGGMSLANAVASPFNLTELPGLVRHFGRRGIYTYITPAVVLEPGCGSEGDYLFRSAHASFSFAGIPEEVRNGVVDELVALRREGHGLTNSTRHLEEFRRFLASGSAAWPCSAGELALDVRPDGRVSICKEKAPLADILSASFPADYRAGEFERLAAAQRAACSGCLYGEYREPHYAVHSGDVLWEWTRDWLRIFRKGMSWRRPGAWSYAEAPALAALAALVLFQAYAYYRVLPLSLGPRVILQPWLMATHGYLPYDHIADQHAPLMPQLLALAVPLFSEGWRAARGVLVALISLTLVLTYLAARRAAGRAAGILAASCFVCWSVPFEFTKLWYESFLAPLYAGLLLLHARAGSRRSVRRMLATGLLCGVALLVKQPAAAVAAAMVAWQVITGWRTRQRPAQIVSDVVLVSAAIAAPFLAWTAGHWARGGSLAAMWYWIVTFSEESSFVSMAAQAPTTREILSLAPAFILVPAALWRGGHLWRRGDLAWERYAVAGLLLFASLLTMYPRFGAFHLAPSLPLVAWLSAMALAHALGVPGRVTAIGGGGAPASPDASTGRLRVGFARAATFGAAALWVLTGAAAYRPVLQTRAPRSIAEYSDLLPLGEAIRRVVGPTESVYIFPDDEGTANLYYVLQRPPPKFWVFSYPWYMTPGARTRIVQTLEQHPPDWVIEPNDSWDVGHHAPDVVAWIRANYGLKGTLSSGSTKVKLLRRLSRS